MQLSKPAPPPNWSPHEWAALPEAFNRIAPSGGPLMPAVHVLRQDLRCGRLESALRQISRDGLETWRSLKPSDWRQWRLQLLRTFQSKPPEIKVIPIDKDEALDEHEHCFFVRRADLDKRYPTTPLAPAPDPGGRRSSNCCRSREGERSSHRRPAAQARTEDQA